jgi:hypothetical protein
MVEMLSEEELESIVGGLVCLENTTSMPLSETKHFPSNNKYLENCNTSIDL